VSVLLVAPGKVGAEVIARLVAQGDEVRVVEGNPQAAERWRNLGARVAQGEADDSDLIERAAQNCRTVVLFDEEYELASVLEATLKAIVHTTADRVVLVSAGPELRCLELLRASGVDYISLKMKHRRLLARPPSFPVAVAEAIDAADDLAGNPHLELDLADPAAAAALLLGHG
jgi:TrkA-N domain